MLLSIQPLGSKNYDLNAEPLHALSNVVLMVAQQTTVCLVKLRIATLLGVKLLK